MTIKTEVQTITPARATELLLANTVNRPPKGAAIKRYAEDIRNGRWLLNGEAIIIRKDGTLLNGQNRLMACVEAETSFKTLVVSGIEGEAMDTIDIGVSRSLGDQLHWRGVSNASTVAAGTKWMYRYDQMVEFDRMQLAGFTLPRDQELAYFDEHRSLIDTSVASIIPLRRRLPGPQSISIFVHFLVARYQNPGKADEFYHQVAYESEAEGAAMKLKDWLIDRNSPYARPSLNMIAAIHIKAARFWLADMKPDALLWKRTGLVKGEPFPRIDNVAAIEKSKRRRDAHQKVAQQQ